MKTNGLTLFLSSCILILFLGCFNTIQASPTEVNDIAPDISLPNKSEKIVTLSSLKGQIVLVHFWVSWDPNSRIINPNVGILHTKYKKAQFQSATGFEVLAVSLDSEKEQWLKAIREDNLPGIHVNDFYSKYAAAYQIEKLPASFLVDERGIVVGKDLSMAELDQYLGKRAATYGVPSQPMATNNAIPPKVAPTRQPAVTTTSIPNIAVTPKVIKQPTPAIAKTGVTETVPPIDVTNSSPTNIIAPSPIATTVTSKVNYKIQVGAYKTVVIDKFKNIMSYGNLSTEKNTSGINRVLVGDFQEADKAATTLGYIKQRGYPDAFVVVYNGTDRERIISEEELVKQDNTIPTTIVAPSTVVVKEEIATSPTNVSNSGKPRVHVPISILATKLPPKTKLTPTANEHEPEASERNLYDTPTSAATYNYQSPRTQNYPYAVSHSATTHQVQPTTPSSLVPTEIAVFEPATPNNYVQYTAPATHKATWYPAADKAPVTYAPANNTSRATTYTYAPANNTNRTTTYTYAPANNASRPAATKRVTNTGQQRMILEAPTYSSNPAFKQTTPKRSGATQRGKVNQPQQRSYTKGNSRIGTTRQQNIRPYSQPKNFSSTKKRTANLKKPANNKTTKGQAAAKKIETDIDRNLSQMLDVYLEGYDYTTIGEDSSDRLKAKQKRLEKKRKKARKKRAKAKKRKRRR